MKEKRSNFTGKIGFVLAAAGSAVGLGNIWRFPYLAAEYGGGLFLLVYLILSVSFGFALMCGEIALGRKTNMSAIGAFGSLNKKFGFVGWIASIVPMIILPYYSVIGGWVTRYLAVFASGNMKWAAGDGYFNEFISKSGAPIFWFCIFIGITALCVMLGVTNGVERVSKTMMPILIFLTIGIAVYVMFIPGAMEGVKYYFIPKYEGLGHLIKTILAAMGQLFYSMSLAMGIMITYGSYMKKDVNIESSVTQIEIFDTGIAFLAGLMVIPAVIALGSEGDIEKSGPGLMFVVLPKVFNNLGVYGHIIGGTFFLLVLFAALTSSISLMETVVSILRDKFGWGRKFTCIIVLIGCIVLGSPSSLGNGAWSGIKILNMDILSFFDFISNSVIMPIVALLTCIFIGYIIKPKAIIDEVELSGKFNRKWLFVVMIKFVAPVFILLILTSSVLGNFAFLADKFTWLEWLKFFQL